MNKTCDIQPVKHKGGSFSWKWRHISADGTVKESSKTYPLFYECVMAARANGYAPQLKCA